MATEIGLESLIRWISNRDRVVGDHKMRFLRFLWRSFFNSYKLFDPDSRPNDPPGEEDEE